MVLKVTDHITGEEVDMPENDDLARAEGWTPPARPALRVIGLDLSLSSTGIALADGRTVRLTSKGKATGGLRLAQLEERLFSILDRDPPAANLAVVEGYSLGSPGKLGLARKAEWHGIVFRELHRRRVPVLEVTPSTLKVWATDNGGADKGRMIARALELGAAIGPDDDDEADAYLLRALGRHVLGVEVLDLTEKQREALGGLVTEWRR